MVEQLSPLDPVWRPGTHGRLLGGAGVTLTETRPGSIVQLAAWPGTEAKVLGMVRSISGLSLAEEPGAGVAEEARAAFGFAPRRYLVVDHAEGLAVRYREALAAATGSVTDLSHGRTALRVAGRKAEWVLAKLFAVDFSPAAFSVGAGRSTVHHDVFAQIQRTGANAFDIYVFRSFARSFWLTLCHACEEVGYEVR